MRTRTRTALLSPALLLAACSGSGSSTGTATPSGPAATAAVSAAPGGAPVITRITFEPAQPTIGDSIRASAAATDPDGDGFIVRWQWRLNGAPLPGQIAETLAPGAFKKGDRVGAEAVARDTKGSESNPIAGEVTIKNSPPTITSQPTVAGASYRVVAVDPDGDPLTFTLKEPVPGFALSPDGTLSYDRKVLEGTQSAVVVVKDAEGAEIHHQVTVSF